VGSVYSCPNGKSDYQCGFRWAKVVGYMDNLGRVFLDLGMGNGWRIAGFGLWAIDVLVGIGDSRNWCLRRYLFCLVSSGMVDSVYTFRIGIFGNGGNYELSEEGIKNSTNIIFVVFVGWV